MEPHYYFGWQSFSAAHDSAQGCKSIEGGLFDEETKEGWNAVKNRNTFVADRLGYITAITMTVSLRDYQGATRHQDREDFATGGIESDRRLQKTSVPCGQFERLRQPIDGINQSAMFDNDPLRGSS